MKETEFQQHVGGAVNSALRDGVHPAIVIAFLDRVKLDVMLEMRQQMAARQAEAQQGANGMPPNRVVGLDGEPLS